MINKTTQKILILIIAVLFFSCDTNSHLKELEILKKENIQLKKELDDFLNFEKFSVLVFDNKNGVVNIEDTVEVVVGLVYSNEGFVEEISTNIINDSSVVRKEKVILMIH